jgi:hypothetical protein
MGLRYLASTTNNCGIKMNERLTELKTQASEDILGVTVLNEEKFARLVVDECATILGLDSYVQRLELYTQFGFDD